MPYSDVKINGRSVNWVKLNGKTWWEKSAPVQYRYIDPVDPVKYPVLTGYKLIHVGTDFGWTDQLDTYNRILKRTTDGLSQSYAPVYSTVVDAGTPSSHAGNKTFMIGGGFIARQVLPGEYEFETLVNEMNGSDLLYPLANPDQSVWKPALRETDGVTGYWNGGDGFIAIYGGIPYLGENLITDEVIDAAYTNAWISAQYVWTNASGSASFPVPVTVGKRYRIAWDNTDGDTVGAVFRYGFTDNNAPSSSNTLSTPRARTTPQDVESVEVEASKDYLIIQVASGLFPENTGHLTVREMVGYDNSDELLTLLTGDNGGANSATMLNTLGGR